MALKGEKKEIGMDKIGEAILGKPKLNQEPFIIKKIPKLKRGDIIIVKMKEDITAGLAQSLVNQLTKTFPDNKSIVVCKGRDLYPLPKEILNDMGWYQKKKSK